VVRFYEQNQNLASPKASDILPTTMSIPIVCVF